MFGGPPGGRGLISPQGRPGGPRGGGVGFEDGGFLDPQF